MPSITATEARKDFFRLLERSAHGHPVHITMRGGARVIMMSEEDYEGWMETLEIMSDKKLMKQIAEAEEDIKHGRVIPWEEVEASLERRARKSRLHKKR